MDILRQCAFWDENDEYQKIVGALEALPEEERSPETDSELARAYNNLADPAGPKGRDMLRKAIALLKPHEEYFAGDHLWNFRMGYAYYYLDRPGRALPYFRAALKALPGDGDTEEFIARCEEEVTLPRFRESFRERTKASRDEFIRREAELRRLLDEGGEDKRSDLIEICGAVLRTAFYDISFELGKTGDRYELVLMPEGDKVRLFELVYFQKHAPAPVRERWNILAGRRANPALALRVAGGPEINGGDVRVWVERRGENGYALSAYCEKLPPRRSEDDARPEWMLWNLTDLILGEIFVMRNVCDFNVLDAPQLVFIDCTHDFTGIDLDAVQKLHRIVPTVDLLYHKAVLIFLKPIGIIVKVISDLHDTALYLRCAGGHLYLKL